MRIRGINQVSNSILRAGIKFLTILIQVSPKVKKVLQLFRLRQINNCVFIKLNKATIAMLRICGVFTSVVKTGNGIEWNRRKSVDQSFDRDLTVVT